MRRSKLFNGYLVLCLTFLFLLFFYLGKKNVKYIDSYDVIDLSTCYFQLLFIMVSYILYYMIFFYNLYQNECSI